jgi:hypothetical protein
MHALLVTADVEPGHEEEGLEYLRTILPRTDTWALVWILASDDKGWGEPSRSPFRERGVCPRDGSSRLAERTSASRFHLPRGRGAGGRGSHLGPALRLAQTTHYRVSGSS